MRVDSLGGYKSINAFVESKLGRFDCMECSFKSLFELMFSEKDNIMYERSDGYRIVKTTYGEAYSAIISKSVTLSRLLGDIEKGSVIGIYMNNSIDWIEVFWAVLFCGYRPLLMNLRMEESILMSASISCGVRAVISDSKQFDIMTIRADSIIPDAEAHSEPDQEFGSEILVMSSGTSSNVKVCAYSAEEIKHQIGDSYGIIKRCRLMKKHYKGELKLLTFLPFYHIFGLVAVYIWFAFFSRTFVQLNDLAPQTIVNTIRRHKVTHIFAVPLFWNTVYAQAIRTIKERGENAEKRFNLGMKLAGIPVVGRLVTRFLLKQVRDELFGDSICFMITGGSEIRRQVIEFFNRIGYHLANGYGASEIGITSVELSNRRSWLNNCYVGKPMRSCEYRINDDGVLLVKSSSAAKRIREGNVVYSRDEWFNTKDLAVCKCGHYQIMGRADDVVIGQNGENLNPCLIEPLFDGIGRGVCLISDRKKEANIPTLVISVKPDIRPEKLIEMQQRVNAVLSESGMNRAIVSTVFITDVLIGDNDFKINRSSIAKRYARGELSIVTPDTLKDNDMSSDMLTDQVISIFAAALEKSANEIGPNSDFFSDCGGTSLDYFAMLTAIQQEYGINLTIGDTEKLNTPGRLAECIRAKMNDD